MIEAGLAAMPDGDHCKAATALLAYDNGRWRPLTKRGSEAAAAFGLGWDAYRRRRESTGSSLVVETMTVPDELRSLPLAWRRSSPSLVVGSSSGSPAASLINR